MRRGFPLVAPTIRRRWSPRRRLVLTSAAIHVAGVAFALWFFVLRNDDGLLERAGRGLEIVGAYATVFGIVSALGILEDLKDLERDMTSGNYLSFVSGNLVAIGIILQVFGSAMDSRMSRGRHILEGLFLLLLIPVVFVVLAFHVFVVLPMAYVGYFLADILVSRVIETNQDVVLAEVVEKDEEGRLRLAQRKASEFFLKNHVPLRSALVALPAALVPLLVRVQQSLGG